VADQSFSENSFPGTTPSERPIRPPAAEHHGGALDQGRHEQNSLNGGCWVYIRCRRGCQNGNPGLLRRIVELSCLSAGVYTGPWKEAYILRLLFVRHWVAVVSLVGAFAILLAPLHADVVFTNLTGSCCGGLAVAGSNFGSVSLATAFTPSVSDSFSDAQIVVFQVLGFGGDPHFNVSLFSDLADTPDTLIEQFGTDLTALPLGRIVTAKSSANPILLAGTQYWLVLTPVDSFTQIGWEEGGSRPDPTDFTTSPTGVGGWIPVGGPNPELQIQVDGVA
jgi:hypothetical protein